MNTISSENLKNQENLSNNKIEVIDGLRGLAILMVLYHHILRGPALELIHDIGRFLGVGQWIGVWAGWLGVNLFFILSGFVLFRPYFLQLRKMSNLSDVFAFYKKRYFRLYPLLIFNCLISFFFILKPSVFSFKKLIFTLSAFSAFSCVDFYPLLNCVLWSLIIEIWFSLLFPFILFLINRFPFKKIGILIFLISLFIRLVGCFYLPDWSGPNPITDSFLGRLDDFFLGFVICKLYYENNKIFSYRSWALFASGIFLFFVASLVGDLAWMGRISLYGRAFMYNFTQLSFFCLIVSAFNLKSSINYFFRVWPLRILGAMCFSIYVWHYMLVNTFCLLKNFNITNFLIYMFFMLSFSALSYRYIEFGKEKSLKKIFLLE
ncbi:TPA: hypothetical protein DEO28_04925 [Candidatus Dependentiae bacterium]|nr:MAG: hypothetical protein UR14_C0002G0098 [candidate division TM6 bacterium GW2011_GWE2_31_21]KKP53895.1 MAG: hypothetical protein UR43_C0002G0098 [candidate division TM6 bacterium GW2011_GWF2_33_332]HBS47675.1 hypothetical protein [Candidatus Dependentiae bacterium]HBZ73824.1 hypothetical protein [Candidatus Dependentiae bacterium]